MDPTRNQRVFGEWKLVPEVGGSYLGIMGKANLALGVSLSVFLLAACAGAGPGSAPVATAADPWAGLATPRTAAMAGAPRVSVGEITTDGSWGSTSVSASVALQELVGAGLLRRADVQYVERRRFSALAEIERRGLPRPEGAPTLGTTPGAELILMGNSLPLGDSTVLNLRLVDPETSETRSAWRVVAGASQDPPALARAIVGSLLGALTRLQRLPGWEDPLPDAAPAGLTPSGIPETAWRAFLSGVAAEDRFQWEAARAAYQRALQLGGPSFFEAQQALARTARLRSGGTLGAS